MTQTFYLRPIALAESPQSEEGEAVRLAGGMVYASRFALIERSGGKVTARTRYSAGELRTALPSLPDAVRVQWDNLQRAHAPLQCGPRTIRMDQPQVMGILNITPDSFSDGGHFMDDPLIANDHAAKMVEAGAAFGRKLLGIVQTRRHRRSQHAGGGDHRPGQWPAPGLVHAYDHLTMGELGKIGRLTNICGHEHSTPLRSFAACPHRRKLRRARCGG